MGLGVKLVVVLLLALGVGWLYDNPIPEGFKDPWELRQISAYLKIINYQSYLKEYTESVRDIFISKRGGVEPDPDPQISKVKVKARDLEFDGVSVRFYTPEGREGDNSSPAVVYLHGGGFMFGSVNSYDHYCQSFSYGSNVKLVAVDYIRAPEHPFPIPLNDCVKASIYLIRNAEKFGIDPTRVAIAGDSAGGNLAAATSLKLRDLRIEPQPKLQVLIVPMLQAIDFSSSSYQLFESDPILPKRIVAASWHLYALGHADHLSKLMTNEHTTPEIKQRFYNKQLNPDIIPDKLKGESYTWNKMDFGDTDVWDQLKSVFLDPYFAPLMSDDVSGLPDAIIMTMGQDVFRDDGIWYAKHLENAGVKVTHHHYISGYHAVIMWPVLYQDNVYESRSILFNLVKEKL